jgi:putative Holliday junction resolvase
MTDRIYLGIDFGQKRIGLAKSDPTGMIATAYRTITYNSINKAIDEIIIDIDNFDIGGVVVGYPISLSGGSEGEKCRMVDDFIARLQKRWNGTIYKIDERFSSSEAEQMIHMHGKKIGRKKERVDRMAAAIILQRFLDEQAET